MPVGPGVAVSAVSAPLLGIWLPTIILSATVATANERADPPERPLSARMLSTTTLPYVLLNGARTNLEDIRQRRRPI
jgi:hypothetical protein